MNRFTKRDEFNNADIVGVESTSLYSDLEHNEEVLLTNALNKLASIEDIEAKLLNQSIKDFIECIMHDKNEIYIINFNEEEFKYEVLKSLKGENMHDYVYELNNGKIIGGFFVFCTTDENGYAHDLPFDLYKNVFFLTKDEAEERVKVLNNEKN